MHQIISHILERRDKSIPVNDGRKITLILFGGIMAGIRGAGAVVALQEMGLQDAFDEIYSVSAGFANASYFLSGQTKLGTSIYYDDLCGNKFIDFRKPWKVVNIDYAVDVMCNKKILNVGRIMANPTKLHVKLLDAKTKEVTYKEVHDVPIVQYMEMMKAAIAIPYLYPHSVQVGLGRYNDSDLHPHVGQFINFAMNSETTDALIIYNTRKQAKDSIKALGRIPDNVYEIIPESDWHLGRFETKRESLEAAAKQMGSFVKSVFGESGEIDLNYDETSRPVSV